MNIRAGRFGPVFSADGASGGAGGDPGAAAQAVGGAVAGAGADASAVAAGAAVGQAAGGAADPWSGFKLPDGLPADWKGETPQATLDKLAGIAKGYRDSAARGVPKDPGEYKFELPDDVRAKYVGDMDQSPVVAAYRKAALDAGLSAEKASALFAKVVPMLGEQGLISPFVDVAAQQGELKAWAREALGKDLSSKEAYEAYTRDAESFLTVMAKQWGLDDRATGTLHALLDVPDGFKIIEKLRGVNSDGVRVGGQAGTVRMSRDELKRIHGDDRLNRNSPKYDPAFVAEVDAAYKHYYS